MTDDIKHQKLISIYDVPRSLTRVLMKKTKKTEEAGQRKSTKTIKKECPLH